jgi:hypothetical protein
MLDLSSLEYPRSEISYIIAGSASRRVYLRRVHLTEVHLSGFASRVGIHLLRVQLFIKRMLSRGTYFREGKLLYLNFRSRRS